MRRRLARLASCWALWALLPLALSTQACSTYSYFDLDLQVGTGFDTVMIGLVTNCHVFATGAANDDFTLDFATCHSIDTATHDIGKVKYSTFADSGDVTFTLRLFEKGLETDGCEIGRGAATLPVPGGKTSPLTVIKANYQAPGTCP